MHFFFLLNSICFLLNILSLPPTSADLVTLMDDDTFVADNFDVDEVISHFQKDNSVQCVGYCLRAAQRRRWLEVLEDFEYMIASFMKVKTVLFSLGH